MALRIGIVTDTHYGYPETADMEDYLVPRLTEVVDHFNTEFEADLVVGLGDFIEHTETALRDRERLEAVGAAFSGLDAPLYAVPGNHDVMHLEAGGVVNALGAVNTQPYTRIDRGDQRLLLLNTTHSSEDLHPVGGVVGREQRNWLERQLDTEKQVHLFAHHPLQFQRLDEVHFFQDKPELAAVQDKELVQQLIQDAPVSTVVNGHLHEPRHQEHNGVNYLSVYAMNKVADTPGITDGGVAHVVVGEENRFWSGVRAVDL